MIIELPNQYERIESKYNYVRVRNGVLELRGNFNFNKLMIKFAYLLKGNDWCYYCNRQIQPHKITIDHEHPINFGGVTITNNLKPACQPCNSRKSNMNQYEFNIWRTLESTEKRKSFYKKTIAKKRKRKNNPKLKKGFDLPKKWVSFEELSKIEKVTKVDNTGSESFKRMLIFARRYQKLPRPLVISSNQILLDGETAYAVAKAMQFKEVPVIMLENVIVLR